MSPGEEKTYRAVCKMGEIAAHSNRLTCEIYTPKKENWRG